MMIHDHRHTGGGRERERERDLNNYCNHNQFNAIILVKLTNHHDRMIGSGMNDKPQHNCWKRPNLVNMCRKLVSSARIPLHLTYKTTEMMADHVLIVCMEKISQCSINGKALPGSD